MKKKIAILTGGGDAPGLNAVIYSIVRGCHYLLPEYDVIGYRFGYRGLYEGDYIPLTLESTSGILHKGGSMLFSSNRDNLFNYSVMENGTLVHKGDVSDIAVKKMKEAGVHTLIVLGGDGTLTSARDFSNKAEDEDGYKVNVIGVPKTIDNDLNATDATFGFDTAVGIATENLGRLHTTAESHHRVLVAQIMGRSAGWITLHAGIAGSADVILIPEIPYNFDSIVKKINERNARGKKFSIIAVSEGAIEQGGTQIEKEKVEGRPDSTNLGGIAEYIVGQLKDKIENEVRDCVFGHIQRGGDTSAADRLLSARYGVRVVELIKEGKFGNMVCLNNGNMEYVALNEVIPKDLEKGGVARGGDKLVDPNGELVRVARSLGISFGDE